VKIIAHFHVNWSIKI